jgi:hypothetical protein
MKLSHDIPAIYHKCHEKFGVNWSKGVIITYGDTVYCKYDLGQDKIVHESTHIKQQEKIDKDEWWNKYLEDKDFRLSQEVEAYRNEAKFIRKSIKDRNSQARLLHQIYIDLSSSIYGNICTFNEAKNFIS